MKTAALITKHACYNYGAVLQSYATENIIESLGVKCELVNYYSRRDIKESKLFSDFFSISGIMHNVRNALTAKSFLKRKKSFCEFMDKYYSVTEKKYTVDNISTLPQDKYDYFITGSDQTFNLNLEGTENNNVMQQKPFYWDFVEHGNKIAFASSLGEHFGVITQEQSKWMAEQLKKYSHISVREKALSDYIDNLINLKPQVVLDPTLLLSGDEWNKIIKPTKYDDSEYILFYTVLSEPWVIEYVKKISELTGLKVLAPHPQNRYEISSTGFDRVDYYGPSEFVSLIKNAKFVVTTSFHGTAFAINYNVPFVSLVLGEGNRISTLLSLCGLEDRAVTEKNKEGEIGDLFNIDYTVTNKKLEFEKQKSINYLKRAMDVE